MVLVVYFCLGRDAGYSRQPNHHHPPLPPPARLSVDGEGRGRGGGGVEGAAEHLKVSWVYLR